MCKIWAPVIMLSYVSNVNGKNKSLTDISANKASKQRSNVDNCLGYIDQDNDFQQKRNC